MEVQKLKKKKGSISKDKIKKTIKNIICRPDAVFWPILNETEENILRAAIKKHSVHIPDYKKPHWNVIKSIPKKDRPKPPQIEKVEGLIFGISQCHSTVKAQNCSAVLIDTHVNPQVIVQPTIEACISSDIPVLCLKDLRQCTLTNFGIKASCMGIKKDCLEEFCHTIQKIYMQHKPLKTVVKPSEPLPTLNDNEITEIVMKKEDPMDVDAYCPYVYRTDMKTRAFVPPNMDTEDLTGKFKGQHFIKVLQENKAVNNKEYKKMVLKKISNNPNRVKLKKKATK